MLTVLLGLGSAAMYGLSDFLGGLLGRRTSVWAVATVTQVTAGIAIGIATLAMAGNPSGADLAWGSLAGIGTGTGTAFLYRGLAAGRMGVVAPLSAVGAALLPVAVGVAIGERPAVIVWLGIGLALPAIWLITTSADPIHVTGRRQRLGAGVADGLLAGLGFGLMFAALRRSRRGRWAAHDVCAARRTVRSAGRGQLSGPRLILLGAGGPLRRTGVGHAGRTCGPVARRPTLEPHDGGEGSTRAQPRTVASIGNVSARECAANESTPASRDASGPACSEGDGDRKGEVLVPDPGFLARCLILPHPRTPVHPSHT